MRFNVSIQILKAIEFCFYIIGITLSLGNWSSPI